jgi:ribonuclease HII
MMQQAADECPQYEFTINFGYASTVHKAALDAFGLTRHHRRTVPLVKRLET